MIISLEEVKEYARIDIDEDDRLLEALIVSAEEYLKNATGREYPETDENGNKIHYGLEKIYLQLLIAHWYEQRSPVGNGRGAYEGSVVEGFSFTAKAIMLQLQMK